MCLVQLIGTVGRQVKNANTKEIYRWSPHTNKNLDHVDEFTKSKLKNIQISHQKTPERKAPNLLYMQKKGVLHGRHGRSDNDPFDLPRLRIQTEHAQKRDHRFDATTPAHRLEAQPLIFRSLNQWPARHLRAGGR